MRNSVVVVTIGSPAATPVAYFSTEERARAYIADVLKRYEAGNKPALHGKHLAPDFGKWSLGLGPQPHVRDVDANVEYLPGARSVRVDEQCRMVGCDFREAAAPLAERSRAAVIEYSRSP